MTREKVKKLKEEMAEINARREKILNERDEALDNGDINKAIELNREFADTETEILAAVRRFEI